MKNSFKINIKASDCKRLKEFFKSKEYKNEKIITEHWSKRD